MKLPEIFEVLKERFSRIIGKGEKLAEYEDVPPIGNADVADYAKKLYTDAYNYYNDAFNVITDGTKYTPDSWDSACRDIIGGDHFNVFGRRKDPNDLSKQEVVKNLIAEQIRVKVAYITSNWHDIDIQPNIKSLSEIFQHERKKIRWGDKIRELVKRCKTYGEAWLQVYYDTDKGCVNFFVRNTNSTYLSPYARGKELSDGCWYIACADMISMSEVKRNYPEIDVEELSITAKKIYKEDVTVKQYGLSKQFPKLEIYLDDWTLEAIPFKEEDFTERVDMLLKGENVEVQEGDNHLKYVELWEKLLADRVVYAQELEQEGLLTEEDGQYLSHLTAIADDQIRQHEEYISKDEWNGKRLKYPHGRRIITICDRVVYDEATGYNFDWRLLFHKLKNESPDEDCERINGRGDVEILLNDNKLLDLNLSRYAEGAVKNGLGKDWLSIKEKSELEKTGGYNQDPTVPAFYIDRPPTHISYEPPAAYLTLVDFAMKSAEDALGVNQVTYGKSPTKQASGDLADILLRQNEVLVTGEIDKNMNGLLSDVVESMLQIMKQFYVEPRIFVINGKDTVLTVSKILTSRIITDEETGEQREEKMPPLEINVRPFSNYPNRWEIELEMMKNLSGWMDENGRPLIPSRMIKDLLGEKYPSLKDERLNEKSEAEEIGRQVIAQQQQKQMNLDKQMQSVKNGFLRQQLKGQYEQEQEVRG